MTNTQTPPGDKENKKCCNQCTGDLEFPNTCTDPTCYCHTSLSAPSENYLDARTPEERMTGNNIKSETTASTPSEYKRDQRFFSELEAVLDEYFPKIDEEGETKRLMKRGDALMLFAAANRIHSCLLSQAVQAERERIREAMSKASGGGSWRRILEQALKG